MGTVKLVGRIQFSSCERLRVDRSRSKVKKARDGALRVHVRLKPSRGFVGGYACFPDTQVQQHDNWA